MGKNDDFAARLARIKEQANAPDPTKGTPTDPRSARAAVQRAPAQTRTTGQLFEPRLILGGVAALALAVYVLSPPSEEDRAAAEALKETRATYSLFKATPGSRLVNADEETDRPLTNDENPYVQKIRANRDRPRTETDRRVALIVNRDGTGEPSGFEMPDNMQPFLNEDGTLTEVTEGLVAQVEGE